MILIQVSLFASSFFEILYIGSLCPAQETPQMSDNRLLRFEHKDCAMEKVCISSRDYACHTKHCSTTSSHTKHCTTTSSPVTNPSLHQHSSTTLSLHRSSSLSPCIYFSAILRALSLSAPTSCTWSHPQSSASPHMRNGGESTVPLMFSSRQHTHDCPPSVASDFGPAEKPPTRITSSLRPAPSPSPPPSSTPGRKTTDVPQQIAPERHERRDASCQPVCGRQRGGFSCRSSARVPRVCTTSRCEVVVGRGGGGGGS